MINDVARAFIETPIWRTVCGELQSAADTGEYEARQAVGLEEFSLYGTRDTVTNFQEEVKVFMSKVCFEQCKCRFRVVRQPGRSKVVSGWCWSGGQNSRRRSSA